MKKNNESLFSFILSGTGIGFPVTALCMTLIGGYNQATREILIWMAASALFGLVSGLFFQKVNLKPIAATALHAVCCLIIASTAGWLCGYAESFLKLLWAILPIFLLIYIVVYLVVFFAMQQNAKNINRTLEKE